MKAFLLEQRDEGVHADVKARVEESGHAQLRHVQFRALKALLKFKEAAQEITGGQREASEVDDTAKAASRKAMHIVEKCNVPTTIQPRHALSRSPFPVPWARS